MSPFNEFFDAPAKRPSKVHLGNIGRKTIAASAQGGRATIRVGDLTIGPSRAS